MGAEEDASRVSSPDMAPWEKGALAEGVMGSRLPAVREHRYLLR